MTEKPERKKAYFVRQKSVETPDTDAEEYEGDLGDLTYSSAILSNSPKYEEPDLSDWEKWGEHKREVEKDIPSDSGEKNIREAVIRTYKSLKDTPNPLRRHDIGYGDPDKLSKVPLGAYDNLREICDEVVEDGDIESRGRRREKGYLFAGIKDNNLITYRFDGTDGQTPQFNLRIMSWQDVSDYDLNELEGFAEESNEIIDSSGLNELGEMFGRERNEYIENALRKGLLINNTEEEDLKGWLEETGVESIEEMEDRGLLIY